MRSLSTLKQSIAAISVFSLLFTHVPLAQPVQVLAVGLDGDLSVDAVSATAPLYTGDPVTFTFRIINNGSAAVAMLINDMNVPSGTTFLSSSHGNCTADIFGVVECQVIPVAGNSTTDYSFTFDTGTLACDADLALSMYTSNDTRDGRPADPNESNNSGTSVATFTCSSSSSSSSESSSSSDSSTTSSSSDSTVSSTSSSSTSDSSSTSSGSSTSTSSSSDSSTSTSTSSSTSTSTSTSSSSSSVDAEPCAADFNGDGKVDAADYTVWRDNLGATGADMSMGDANEDGVVDGADYLIWQRQFGSVCAPTCNGELATIYVRDSYVVGGPMDGQIYTGVLDGTIGDDVIVGTFGEDQIYGYTGHDLICGRAGDDTIIGGFGDDRIFGNLGNDTIEGNVGEDFIHGGFGNDTISGGLGADEIYGWFGNDNIMGDPGDDVIFGNAGDDTIYGELGADTIKGGFGNDKLYGGAEDDEICGDNGDDIIEGNLGDDTICGGKGNDDIQGQLGNDLIDGGEGTDILNGGANNDVCVNGETVAVNCEDTVTPVPLCEEKDGSSSSSSTTSSSESSSSSDSSGSSSESTSSSSESSEGSSTSSDGPTDSPVVPLAIVTDESNDGTGSNRGADTNVMGFALLNTFRSQQQNSNLPPAAFGGGPLLQNSVYYSTNLAGDLPPAAFGGGDVFTSDQRDVICTAQKMLVRSGDRLRAIQYMAGLIRNLYNFDAAMEQQVREALNNSSFCEGLTEVRHTQYGKYAYDRKQKRSQVSIAIDADGVPVSSDPVWNQCIRGVIPMDEEKNPYNCKRFMGFRNTWYHPDFPAESVAFSWNARDPRGTEYPNNFHVVRLEEELSEEDILLAASVVNRIL